MTDGVIDTGLLSPVSAGREESVSDREVLRALIEAECALVHAYASVGALDAGDLEHELADLRRSPIDTTELARAAVSGGNPVIPLVAQLRRLAGDGVRGWIHRGATSQDIQDTGLMLVAGHAGGRIVADLDRTVAALERFAAEHRDEVAPARTLTQQAVPTTVGLRAANWVRGVRRARSRLAQARENLPAQLAGAGGTLASFVEILGPERAARMPAAFAANMGLAAPDGAWHVIRWPVTELGDALVQAVDALGKIATDIATLSRTESGELAEPTGGGSSAMPQKQNPTRSVLIRSAAIRAPQLAATLHTASALASDERPDGAWHAEWPALRDLLRAALGAASHAADLTEGLRVNHDAVVADLAATDGLIVSERLAVVLGAVAGKDRVTELIAQAGGGEQLATLIRRLPEIAEAGIDVDALLDPAEYTGLAGEMVDAALGAADDETGEPEGPTGLS